ncbi:MAG: ABC transporter permease, partial [Clostridia bacterium]|nr:ABC transporter permease [Clostridia bacterium]
MKHESKVLLINILKKPLVSTLFAIMFGFLIAGVIVSTMGYSAKDACSSLVTGVFSRPKYIFKVIEKSTPMIFAGISMVFAFKAGLFNIGVEGQYIISSVASTVVGILFNFHPIVQVPLVILSGILASTVLSSLTGFLKAKFGVHEVISGIMFNW